MIVKVKYSYILWDNCQGAQGKPFVGETIMDLPSDTSLCKAYQLAVNFLMEKRREVFIGETRLLDISLPCDPDPIDCEVKTY